MWFFVQISVIASLFSLPLHAAEIPYTPPPLFGGAAPASQIIDIVPIPTMPPPEEEKSALKPDVTSLKEAASVAERVPNPVQSKAPMNVDVLLDHPADRVSADARPLVAIEPASGDVPVTPHAPGLPDVAPPLPTVSAIPNFLSYDDDQKPKAEEPRVTKDLSVPAVPGTKPRVAMKPEPTEIRPEKPRVAIYSRDKKTGQFHRVDDDERTASRGSTTIYHAKTVPSNMPAVQPVMVTRDSLTKDLPRPIDPIALEDLSVNPTPPPDLSSAPLPLFQDTLAATEPATGDAKAARAPTQLAFEKGDANLADADKAKIETLIEQAATGTAPATYEIHAFSPVGAKNAQALALGRGLAVRQYMKEKGIDPAQITVRVLAPSVDAPGGVEIFPR